MSCFKPMVLVLAAAALATGCDRIYPGMRSAAGGAGPAPSKPAEPAAVATQLVDQETFCETKVWLPLLVAGLCKPGQKVAFLPDSWGNEQLPVIFAALNCDLRYQVALTKGAVTCIFRPAHLPEAEGKKEAPAGAERPGKQENGNP